MFARDFNYNLESSWDFLFKEPLHLLEPQQSGIIKVFWGCDFYYNLYADIGLMVLFIDFISSGCTPWLKNQAAHLVESFTFL